MLLELFDIAWIVSVNNLRESKRLLYYARKYHIDSHFTFIRTHQTDILLDTTIKCQQLFVWSCLDSQILIQFPSMTVGEIFLEWHNLC